MLLQSCSSEPSPQSLSLSQTQCLGMQLPDWHLNASSGHFISPAQTKERNGLFNNTLNTFHLRLYGTKEMVYFTTYSTHFIYGYMEGRKEMFYLTTHSTHFIYGYMMSDIWLKTILIVRKGNPLPPHRLLFPINSKGSFICTDPQTG